MTAQESKAPAPITTLIMDAFDVLGSCTVPALCSWTALSDSWVKRTLTQLAHQGKVTYDPRSRNWRPLVGGGGWAGFPRPAGWQTAVRLHREHGWQLERRGDVAFVTREGQRRVLLVGPYAADSWAGLLGEHLVGRQRPVTIYTADTEPVKEAALRFGVDLYEGFEGHLYTSTDTLHIHPVASSVAPTGWYGTHPEAGRDWHRVEANQQRRVERRARLAQLEAENLAKFNPLVPAERASEASRAIAARDVDGWWF